MSVAKGQTTCVLDPAVTARIKPLVEAWGIRPLARKIGIRREAILAAERGTPMTERMWTRIGDAIASVPLAPAPEDLIPVRRERESRPASPKCAACGLRRVFQSCAGESRSVCHKCRNGSELSLMSRCSTCGTERRGPDMIASSFCCLLVPEKVGECGWCGCDLVRRLNESDAAFALRRFCKKACSISFHSDASEGTFSEAMVGVPFAEYSP